MGEDFRTNIAFQGSPGAYSNMACLAAYPEMTPLPCPTFEDTFMAVTERRAALAMIPIENSIAGRVADIHHLLPKSGLHVIAEHFQGVNHHLLAQRGATLEGITQVHSHIHALAQCRTVIRELGLDVIVSINAGHYGLDPQERGDEHIQKMLEFGINDFQIDSCYDHAFFQSTR